MPQVRTSTRLVVGGQVLPRRLPPLAQGPAGSPGTAASPLGLVESSAPSPPWMRPLEAEEAKGEARLDREALLDLRREIHKEGLFDLYRQVALPPKTHLSISLSLSLSLREIVQF